MRTVGAKVAVGVIAAGWPVIGGILVCIMVVLALLPNITPTATFIVNRHRLGHPSRLMALSLHFFYIKQAAPRPSEQAHGARLALLLRLQRDNSLVVVYLGRCPRLYTAALTARVAQTGLSATAMGEATDVMAKAEFSVKSKKLKE